MSVKILIHPGQGYPKKHFPVATRLVSAFSRGLSQRSWFKNPVESSGHKLLDGHLWTVVPPGFHVCHCAHLSHVKDSEIVWVQLKDLRCKWVIEYAKGHLLCLTRVNQSCSELLLSSGILTSWSPVLGHSLLLFTPWLRWSQ